MPNADHFTRAKEWVLNYLRENPDHSTTQICKAANAARLTVSHDFVAGLKRHYVVDVKDRAPFNPPKLELAQTQEVEKASEPLSRNRVVVGKMKKVVTIAELVGTRGMVAVILECSHARVMSRSEVHESALCQTCQDAETIEAELQTVLRPLVKKIGLERVLDCLSKLELP